MNPTLLPPNRTEYERAVEDVSERATSLPVNIDTLWRPQSCPENLLPWLAWALSVDTWDSQWHESIKRKFIADSVAVHRIKGTRAAINRVLSGLAITIELEEWFEYGGQPHTFRLRAKVSDNFMLDPNGIAILSAEAYRNLRNAINQVKPVRAHYEFTVTAAFNQVFSLGFSSDSLTLTTNRFSAVIRPSTQFALGITPLVRAVAYVRAFLQS